MLDDSVRVAKLVMLTGSLVLTIVYLLMKKNELDRTKPQIRNMSMMFGSFLKFASDMGRLCRDNEDGWKAFLLEFCRIEKIRQKR